MSNDIGKFLVFVAIVMAAFTSGMGTLYGHYRGAVHKDRETGEVTLQEDSFVTMADTFRTLFWGIFCMTTPEAADVVVADAAAGAADASTSLDDTQQPHFTEVRDRFRPGPGPFRFRSSSLSVRIETKPIVTMTSIKTDYGAHPV